MKRRTNSIFLLTLILLALTALPAIADHQARVIGTVQAIDAAARPQTIVIKTTTAGGKILIVGCRLDQKTQIRVGRQAAALEEIQPGDRVEMFYQRVEDGLVAQKIEKRQSSHIGNVKK